VQFWGHPVYIYYLFIRSECRHYKEEIEIETKERKTHSHKHAMHEQQAQLAHTLTTSNNSTHPDQYAQLLLMV